MIRRFAAAPLVVLLTVAGCQTHGARWQYHNEAPPLGKIEPVTLSPGVQMPSADWVDGHYPVRARYEGPVSGRARIWCTVGATGSLDACQTMDEFPRGHDFGAAAVKIMRRGRADLETAPTGSQVEIELTFTAAVEVFLECDLSVERLATHCRAYHQSPHGAGAFAAQVARDAEGKPPPPSETGRLPGRMRWQMEAPVPIVEP